MKLFFWMIKACLILLILHCPGSEARQYRNIFSLSSIDYENIGSSTVYENAFIAEIRPRFSFLIKGYHDRRSSWNNTIITLGPIFNIDRYHYVEINYGHGQDSDKKGADYYSVELTREKPGYLLGIGFKHSSYPGYKYHTISPSIRYYLTPRIALWGKYFLSTDSDDNINSAFWFDCEVKITGKMAVRSGFTGGNRLYSPEYESFLGGKADMRFFSFLAQFSYIFSEQFTVKYQFEQVSRQSEFTDIKNLIILDVRLWQ
ncbi:hypothetical protein ACFL50_01480 [Candidatus Latescibacterota bacterium]